MNIQNLHAAIQQLKAQGNWGMCEQLNRLLGEILMSNEKPDAYDKMDDAKNDMPPPYKGPTLNDKIIDFKKIIEEKAFREGKADYDEYLSSLRKQCTCPDDSGTCEACDEYYGADYAKWVEENGQR